MFRRPRHSGFVGATWAWQRFTADLTGVFIGRYVDSDFSSLQPPMLENPGYTTWDARFVYALPTTGARASLDRQPGKRRLHGAARVSGIAGARCASACGSDSELVATKPRAAISWSGGKDSCAALHRTHADYDVVAMVTMFDEEAERSRSHGLRPEVIGGAGRSPRPAPVTGRCTWETYDELSIGALAEAKNDGVTHVIFGDIMFDEHRLWAERMCARARADGGRAALWLVDRGALSRMDRVGRRRADRDGARRVSRRELARPAAAARDARRFRPARRRSMRRARRIPHLVTNSPLFREPLARDAERPRPALGLLGLDMTIDAARD